MLAGCWALRTGGHFGVDCKALKLAAVGGWRAAGAVKPFLPSKPQEIYAKFRSLAGGG
jgi:hypothetical protein